MQQYVSTKIVTATPMTRQEYNNFRGWQLPADENGADEGYLVEYHDGGQSNVDSHKGYVSWSPKDVFERASVAIGDISAYEPHHQRMMAERAQLCDRISKLVGFIGSEKYLEIESIEQCRLNAQLDYMMSYRRELDERLIAINEKIEPPVPVA